MAKAYTWRRLRRRSACAAGSIRTVRSGGALVRVCCPKGPGHWQGGVCSVGTVAYEVGKKKRGKR